MHNLILSESEKNKILNQHKTHTKDYVFDFVITENQKYLILFDNVFIKEDGGKCLGKIWENTNIFNELLIESLQKLNNINESIIGEFNRICENISWNKDEIKNWVSETTIINEQGILNSIVSGAKEIGGKIMSSVSNVAMSVFKQGILPLLRWIRKNAYTNIGIVVDAVVAFFSFKSSAVVWFLIVAIDIYEIATGDFDPQDTERKNNPYGLLISDALSAIMTTAFGFLFRRLSSNMTKGALKKYPNLIDALKKLLQKIPFIKNNVINVINVVKNKMPKSSTVIGKILSSINNVFNGLINFLRRLLSYEGVEAVASGGIALGIHQGLNNLSGNKNNNVQQSADINTEESDVIKFAKQTGYLQ